LRGTSLFSLLVSLLLLVALVGALWIRRDTVLDLEPTRTVTVKELPEAAEGSLLVEGSLQLDYIQPYTRTYSVLGREQIDRLHVAPFTAEGWQPTMPIEALAVIRGEHPRAFSGPVVNLGPASVTLTGGLHLAQGAVLLELVPAEAPVWWLVIFGAAFFMFFLLGLRGVIKRLSK
jgi:hypothetical protein